MGRAEYVRKGVDGWFCSFFGTQERFILHKLLSFGYEMTCSRDKSCEKTWSD